LPLPGGTITIARMRVRSAICAAIVGVASIACGAESTWELRGDRWVEIPRETPATAPAVEPLLDQAEAMILAGNHKAGLRTAVQWMRGKPKDTPQRDRALMLIAEASYLEGDRIDAYYYLEQLMDEHPDSPLFHRALQRQYDIADAFLNGYKRVFIWFPILDAEDEAIDMLYRLQQRAPGSAIAEKALLRTADHYFNKSDFDLASDAYGVYLSSYGRSPLVPQVRLKRAYATLAQFRGIRYDATPLIDARAQLVDIANTYPDIADEEGLDDLIRRIDETFARKLYRTADFYRRTREPKAAVYHYRYLIATFPNSAEAKLAAERLSEFDDTYLQEPPPNPGEGYAPRLLRDYPEGYR